MNKKIVRKITDNALVAALYYISTLLIGDLAFSDVQFRFAEILLFLVFFRKDFIIGITLGCFLANLNSPLMPWDLIFGTLATFLSALLFSFSKKMYWGILYSTLINGVVVGTMLHLVLELPLFPSIGLVALGQAIVLIFGHALFKLLGKNQYFLSLIMSERNENYEQN